MILKKNQQTEKDMKVTQYVKSLYTVNSEIFARVLFSRIFPNLQYLSIKAARVRVVVDRLSVYQQSKHACGKRSENCIFTYKTVYDRRSNEQHNAHSRQTFRTRPVITLINTPGNDC